MGPDGVVVPPPPFGKHLRLEECVEDLPLHQFVTELAIETLDVAVLPERLRLDVERLYADASQPLPDSLRRELAPVVAADVFRDAATHEQVAEPLEDVLARELPGDIDREALTGVLVHDRQHPEGTALGGAVQHEVIAVSAT